MVTLDLSQASVLRPLFPHPTDSCTVSCFEGAMGKAFADRLSFPTVGAVHLGEYLYIEGQLTEPFLTEILEYGHRYGLTVISRSEQIRCRALQQGEEKQRFQMEQVTIPEPQQLQKFLQKVPSDFRLLPIDQEIYRDALQNQWSEAFVGNFDSFQHFQEYAFGFCIYDHQKLISGASAYSYCHDGIEVVIATQEQYRRRGLAIAAAARLLLECQNRQLRAYWDAANTRSVGLASQLGYRLKEIYYGVKLYES